MKIVVVDDEYFVRVGIASVVQKIEGIEVVGQAENGDEAIGMILKKNPDLVFLDITMPGKDGIEVLKELREKKFNKKIVLLTSHDDFQLTRNALRLGASDYVLKNELIGDNMIKYLKKLQISLKNESLLVNTHNENTPRDIIYKERFLQSLMRDGGNERDDFNKIKKEYSLNFSFPYFYVLLIEINGWRSFIQTNNISPQNFYSEIKSITHNAFQKPFEFESFYNRQNQYVLLVSNPQVKSTLTLENQLKEKVELIHKSLNSYLDLNIKIAIQKNKHSFENINLTYLHAHHLLEQQYFYPNKNIFLQGILEPQKIASFSELKKDLEKDNTSLSEVIQVFLEANQNSIIYQKDFMNIIIPKIRLLKQNSNSSYDIDTKDFLDINSLINKIKKLENSYKNSITVQNYNYLIKQAVNYIETNFHNKISLDEVAETLEVSPSYLSRLFSSETGITFSNYLTNIRLDYAKELLITTNLKLYQISHMAGFSSPIYFNISFKKEYNMTPKMFRDSKKLE